MAKLKAPLFSFGARGQLGKALVFFPWKGLDCVREYVQPANPNTADQQTQRGYLGDAVDDWHGIGLDAADVTAWNRAALHDPRPMSGFNKFCSDHIAVAISGETPEFGYDGALADDADDTFSGAITEGGDADAVDMIWGVSPTSLINTSAGAETANTWDCTPADNVAGQTIYARFVLEKAGNVIGRTGIYTVKMAP